MTSEDVDTFRTMFMFSPPDDQPTGWSLTFEGFADALRTREADAPTEQWSGVFSGETLSFIYTTTAGGEAEGMASVEPNGVSIDGCTCTEAAEFVHWLQAAVIPPDAPVQVNMTEGVEWELPAIELPRDQQEPLRDVLTGRLREILDHEEEHLG
ncbi:hypothetical protein RM572_15755 [Streptomyces sp. DSM 42041]|uniref:Uncharacterized protein n=1 Tax=Streptomyces hazeniae TaxID=3075538 RepID=A0ABU2NTA1_9ACTN|nr:hypothetical protein [Streptomyces sp. DSM 42041]MDT0380214.1 hypothetical protein [Streptomyces sp. DSM 42041]